MKHIITVAILCSALTACDDIATGDDRYLLGCPASSLHQGQKEGDILKACGRPAVVSHTFMDDGHDNQQWVYGSSLGKHNVNLYFENGILRSWQDYRKEGE